MPEEPAEPGRREGELLAAACLERARAVAPTLAAASARGDVERELTADALVALHDSGLFRLTLPAFLGGAELELALLAQVTEVVAMADASAAWCLGQAFGCATSAAYLDEAPARRVFGPREAVLAWGAGAMGKAIVAEGGYRVTGHWRFASGAKHAAWLGAHCKVYEADHRPRLLPNGAHARRTALFPRETAEIADDWYVIGLKATRSEGYGVEDQFVEDALTIDRETPDAGRVDATLYRFTMINVYASAFSGVALGIARGALDDLLALARTKTPHDAPGSLRDSAVFQLRLAELEAQLGSARAYQQQVLHHAWQTVSATRTLTMEERAPIRLATTYAVNQATEVVEQAYRLAGSTAIFENAPFERRLRDAYAVSQQVQGRQSNYETVGRFMLGLDADSPLM